MGDNSFGAQSESVDIVRLGRTLRRGQEMGLSPELLQAISQTILDSVIPAATEATIAPPPPEELKHAQLMLRHLVELDKPWAEIEPHALSIFTQAGNEFLAAKLTELAFLHGDIDDTLAMIKRALTPYPKFYAQVHATIRARIVLAIWHHPLRNYLANLLQHHQDSYLELVPSEYLLILHHLQDEGALPGAYFYFLNNETAIIEAAKQHGAHFNLSVNSVYLSAAKIAYTQKDTVAALKWAEQVSDPSPEFGEAQQLTHEAEEALASVQG